MNHSMEIKNRTAYFEYFIDAKYDAGIMLTGTEVKSLREGKASFNDSYCLIHKGEAWLKNFHIAEYSHGTVNNHEPLRERKLLLQKREMKKTTTLLVLLVSVACYAQSVSGYWYGNANVKSNSSANNYLVELILKQDRTQVKGIVNYYFKKTFRSIKINGNFNSLTRQLTL